MADVMELYRLEDDFRIVHSDSRSIFKHIGRTILYASAWTQGSDIAEWNCPPKWAELAHVRYITIMLKLEMGIYLMQANTQPIPKCLSPLQFMPKLAPDPAAHYSSPSQHYRRPISIASLSPINTLPPSPSISPAPPPSLKFGSSMPLSMPSCCCCSEMSSSPGASARSSSSSEA